MVEFDDDTNSISKCVYDHNQGEIWHMASAPNNKLKFLTCYNKSKGILKVFFTKDISK